jgi:RNA polymerase sigma factor (sigma-70 family)
MEPISELVIAAQGGDLDAFESIVGRFQDMAYASAYSILNDAQLAEDVTQEAFIETFLNLTKLREPAAFPGWFRRIVFKQSDRLTRGKHIPTMPLENAYDIPVVDFNLATFIEERERDELVRRAVEDLPEHERIATLLFYSTGYALRDIAEFLEVPVTTIKKRLHDARKHLKESLLEAVRDSLHEQRQSKLDLFSYKVQVLIAIRMDDIGRVKALLDQYPMLVNMKMERDESTTQPYSWIGSGLYPLYEAARNGNVTMVKLLLDYGAVMHTRKYNALSAAAQFNHKEVVQLLLDRGADASGRSKQCVSREIEVAVGSTPLRLAALKGYREIVKLLLEHGAIVDASGQTGRTALHWASLKGRREIVKLLLDHGADIYAKDELGRSPFDWALIRGQLEVANLLREHFVSDQEKVKPGGKR